ncbi:MAG: phasin family protein, partial [Actinobacteria bacterium]|nr:phasin family protein [Actinomycetota bacterium]
MIDDVRKYMEATLEKLTPAKAQEMARALMKGQGREQVTKAAQDLLEWSHKSRERMKELVQREVKAQLKALGVATRDEVDALRKRVRELERGGAAKRTAAKKSSPKRTAAR